jgi:lysophospholipase L1-like esterase
MSLAALALALSLTASAAPRRPLLVVALGDSTTAGTPGFLSPLEAPPEGRGDPRSQYVYWLMRARPGWKALNRGVNGERADQIRARFARDVEAVHPRDVIVLAGVNDVYQGRSLGDAEKDLLWMYRRAKELGIVPVAASALPFTRATNDQNLRLAALNAWIRVTANAEKIPFCDAAAAVADPKDPSRLKGSPDGYHPDVAGDRALGEALAKALKP